MRFLTRGIEVDILSTSGLMSTNLEANTEVEGASGSNSVPLVKHLSSDSQSVSCFHPSLRPTIPGRTASFDVILPYADGIRNRVKLHAPKILQLPFVYVPQQTGRR